MPRVSINKKKYLLTDFREWVIGRMRTLQKTQADMGSAISLSQTAFSKRLEESNFTYEQIVVILKELQATDEEILRFMKL
jgi:hypothetical protein